MKIFIRLFKVFIVILMAGQFLTAKALDSLKMATARDYFSKGLDAYNQGNYPASINYLKISIRAAPRAITYYLISNAYAKSDDYDDALSSIRKALSTTPPLDNDYQDDANKIRNWAAQRIKERDNPPPKDENGVSISQNAITIPLKCKIPDQSENPFKRPAFVYVPLQHPGAGNKPGWRFTFPGPGRRNENQQIGDFCCTGETATVLNPNNVPLGYIYFYDFEGGMNLGNGRSSASKLKILLSGTQNINDAGASRAIDEIDFSGAELRPGAVKYKTIGALTYKVVILSVQKYGTDSFMTDAIRVDVEVSD